MSLLVLKQYLACYWEGGTRKIITPSANMIYANKIVVSSDVNYGMGRMMEIFSEQRGVDVKVFKEFETAKLWLKKE